MKNAYDPNIGRGGVGADFDWKQAVRVAAVGNVALGTLAPGVVIDGKTLAAGDRFLLPDQTDPKARLIYILTATSYEIASDSGQGKLSAGAIVVATEGNVNEECKYQLTTNDPIVVGTTDLTWYRTETTAGLTLNEPAGDNSAGTQGIFDSATVGETVAFPNLLYQKSDGKWWKADATAATTMPGLRMALESKNADETCSMLVTGRVRDDDWSWTVGGLIYASAAAAGGLTQTQPSGSGDQVQIVGHAYHVDKMVFDPSPVIAEVM